MAARSQFPDRPAFQGWIAFNPGSKLTQDEMFVVSVHEIGHLLGLPHNPSGSSMMYFPPTAAAKWTTAVSGWGREPCPEDPVAVTVTL